MNRFTSRQIARFAPGEMGIAEFAMQVVTIMVSDRSHVGRPPRPEVLELLVRAALTGDPVVLDQLLAAFRRLRIPAEVAVDTYIPAAVDRIGLAWHADEIDILDTSIAIARIQNLLRELVRAWHSDSSVEGAGGELSVLMVVPEAEQHTVGAMVATAQLRRLGVSVCLQLAPSPAALEHLCATRRFDAVFLSLGNVESLDRGRNIVDTVRKRATGRGPFVMVGGSLDRDAELVKQAVGADLVTRDIRDAHAHLTRAETAPSLK